MNIVFYAVPEPVAQTIADRYGFDLYRSAEEFEAAVKAPAVPQTPVEEAPEVASDAASEAASEAVPETEITSVAADVADGQIVIPHDGELREESDAEVAAIEMAGAPVPAPADSAAPAAAAQEPAVAAQGRILLLGRLDSEERQSEFVEWMERFSDRIDAVISGQSSTISTVYYASQPGKFFSVERRHSDDDCEDLCYELSRIVDALLGGGTAHEEI